VKLFVHSVQLSINEISPYNPKVFARWGATEQTSLLFEIY